MVKRLREPGADLRGINRLVMSGIVGVVDLVEAMHYNVASIPGLVASPKRDRTTGITGLVYRSIRGIIGLAGRGLDGLLAQLEPLLGKRSRWPGREALLAALNGVLGDYLAASNNPLAITMDVRRGGVALPDERESLAAAIPYAGGKLLVLLHGLCMNDLQWKRKGHDHGAALARDLAYTPVYLHYNSGLHISTNGRAFAERLETLVKLWPVPLTELVIIGHSMGGLVARSACHYGGLARHEWRRRLDKLLFIGTPHHGAPLERGGNWVDLLLGASRYSAPLARLGKIPSAGITDLRFENLRARTGTTAHKSRDTKVAWLAAIASLPVRAPLETMMAANRELVDGATRTTAHRPRPPFGLRSLGAGITQTTLAYMLRVLPALVRRRTDATWCHVYLQVKGKGAPSPYRACIHWTMGIATHSWR